MTNSIENKASVDEANLQAKQGTATPAQHLLHLLKIGWNPQSSLIRRYVHKNNLEEVLELYAAQESR